MTEGPMVRASIGAAMIRTAREKAIPGLGVGLERLPAGLLGRLDGAPGFDWVPLADFMAVLQCIRNCAGDRGLREVARDMGVGFSNGALLRGFRDTAFRLFGVRTEAIVRWAPRAMPMLFRGVFTLRQELLDEPCTAHVELRDFARGNYRFDTFVEFMVGTFDGQIAVAGDQGSTEVTTLDEAKGYAEMKMRWKPR